MCDHLLQESWPYGFIWINLEALKVKTFTRKWEFFEKSSGSKHSIVWKKMFLILSCPVVHHVTPQIYIMTHLAVSTPGLGNNALEYETHLHWLLNSVLLVLKCIPGNSRGPWQVSRRCQAQIQKVNSSEHLYRFNWNLSCNCNSLCESLTWKTSADIFVVVVAFSQTASASTQVSDVPEGHQAEKGAWTCSAESITWLGIGQTLNRQLFCRWINRYVKVIFQAETFSGSRFKCEDSSLFSFTVNWTCGF